MNSLIGLLAGSSSVAAVWLWLSLSPKVANRKLIRHRYAVTLKDGNGDFAGQLAESSRGTLVFENCATIPHKPTDISQPIAGRVRVDRVNVAYLQELPNVVE